MGDSEVDIVFIFSKVLGYLIVFGSAGVKIPQILSIISKKSAVGLSLSSVFLELIGFSICLSYNVYKSFPFSTWGEYSFMTVQDYLIIALMFYYSKQRPTPIQIGLFCLYIAVFGSSLLQLLNEWTMDKFMQITIPLTIAAKLPQIVLNFRSKSTGVLSPITWTLVFGGSTIRLFTTFKEVDDFTVLLGYLIAVILNFTTLSQIIFYRISKSKGKVQ